MKYLFKLWLVLLSYTLAGNTLFAGGLPSEEIIESSPLELQQFTTLNPLSSDLLASKLAHDGFRNTLVSSVSLYYALSVLELGAAGGSSDVLHSVLLNNARQSVADIAPPLAEVLVLSNDSVRQGVGRFQLANAIWSTTGETSGTPFVFSEQFISESMHFYGAPKKALDFMAGDASKIINDWAFENTHGLIPEIIDNQTLRTFNWVITNAAYFEGGWGTSMRRIRETPQYRFKRLDGSETEAVSIKTRDYKAQVVDGDDGSVAFSLPFVDQKYSLVAYVPPALEPDIKKWLLDRGVPEMPNIINEVLNNQSTVYQLSLQLPVFSYSDGFEMKKGSKIAGELGLSTLFSKQANFLRMVDKEKTPWSAQDTQVGLIKQNTKIELDEKGVKAAAVTLIGGISKTSVGPRFQRRSIVVDRPFVYAIIENSSRTMLFNGVLTNPTE